jgi:hypothetical protein
LHELEDQHHRPIRAQLLVRQLVEASAAEGVGIEAAGRTAHEAGEAQPQLEIIMHHEAQPPEPVWRRRHAQVLFGGARRRGHEPKRSLESK